MEGTPNNATTPTINRVNDPYSKGGRKRTNTNAERNPKGRTIESTLIAIGAPKSITSPVFSALVRAALNDMKLTNAKIAIVAAEPMIL